MEKEKIVTRIIIEKAKIIDTKIYRHFLVTRKSGHRDEFLYGYSCVENPVFISGKVIRLW